MGQIQFLVNKQKKSTKKARQYNRASEGKKIQNVIYA